MEKSTSKTKHFKVLDQRKLFESEEVNFPSKFAELSDEMSSLKTEIRRLEAEIIADIDRMKEEQSRIILESIVEKFQQKIVISEKEKQLAEDEKGYGIYIRNKYL